MTRFKLIFVRLYRIFHNHRITCSLLASRFYINFAAAPAFDRMDRRASERKRERAVARFHGKREDKISNYACRFIEWTGAPFSVRRMKRKTSTLPPSSLPPPRMSTVRIYIYTFNHGENSVEIVDRGRERGKAEMARILTLRPS